MKIYKDAIWKLASGGYMSIQIPDFAIGSPVPDIEEVSDDWIVILRHRRPVVGRESGFSFLTRKGYEANKERILKEFTESGKMRGTVEEFEQYVEDHFVAVNRATKKYLDLLNKKVAQMSAIVQVAGIKLPK